MRSQSSSFFEAALHCLDDCQKLATACIRLVDEDRADGQKDQLLGKKEIGGGVEEGEALHCILLELI